ncbi:MAG: putative two-component system sensor kinase [Frankiales bacterium]|nr:putative two-component system sensor kinase [Frankiales bacterium]
MDGRSIGSISGIGFGAAHPTVGADDGFDAQIERPFRWLPYPLLGVSLLVALLDIATSDGLTVKAIIAVLGSIGAALWTVTMLPRESDVDLGDKRLVYYFIGRFAVTAVLVYASPWFGIYAWFAYVESIRYFPLPKGFLAIFASSLLVSSTYLGGYPRTWLLAGFYALLVTGSSVLVGFFAINTRRSADNDRQRRQALVDIREANHRLQAALDENRGLQTQLITQAREAGVADERARLAGEIHDTLAQTLTGIITQLQAADRGGELDYANRRHVEQARALARTGLAEARRSLHAMRPGQLDSSRLPEAISSTATSWSQRTGVPALIDVTGAVVQLATDHEIALLRVAQEALANVERHADASRVVLTLSYLDDAVLLDVRDDGIGFVPVGRPDRGDGSGVGLATMRERLARVDGELALESEPGEGTAVAARVPLVLSIEPGRGTHD